MREEITKQDIRDFLENNRLAIISTVDNKNNPDAAPIYYISEDDFLIYFVTPNKTHKYKNIQTHSKVALTVVSETSREIVQIKGSAKKADVPLDSMLKKLAERVNSDFDFITTLPLLKYKDQKKEVIKIEPHTINVKRFTDEKIIEKTIDLTT